MLSKILQTTGFLSSGGTISGDLTVEGDFVVEGDGSLSLDSTITGEVLIIGGDGTVSGTTDADANELVIRNAVDAGMHIFAGESSGHTSSIVFGSASDPNGANMHYEYNTKTMKLGTQHGSGILTLRSGNGTNALTIDASQNIGIGIDSPDGAGLHIHSATAGSVTAHANADELVVEGSGATGISILTADAQTGAIMFGCPSDTQAARITNTQSTGVFTVGASQTGGVLKLEAGAGNTRMIIDDNSRISLSNNDLGTSNTVFGKLAGDDLASGGNYNVFIGENAGHENSVGDRNVAIGFNAYDDGHTLANLDNIFIGYGSGGGTWVTAASTGNTAIGSGSMTGAQNGALNNTVIGYQAGNVISTGDENVAIGKDSLLDLQGGSGNTGIGTESLANVTSGSENVGIGKQALYTITTVGSNTAVGYQALKVNTAAGNTAIGHSALLANTSGVRNLAIGKSAADAIIGTDDSIAIGYEALTALATDNAARNMAIGNYAIKTLNADGRDNIAIGFEALETANHADIDGNIAIGNYVLDDVGTAGVWGCTALGFNSMTAANHANASGTTAVGYYALAGLLSGAGNTAVGYQSGLALTTGVQNTLLGYQSGLDLNEGGRNTAVGYAALSGALDANGDESVDNTFIGHASGSGDWVTAVSNYNTAVGSGTMIGDMNGALENTAIGYGAGNVISTGDGNVAVGKAALNVATTGGNNVAVGKSASLALVDVDDTVSVGVFALSKVTDSNGDGAVALGAFALQDLNTGAANGSAAVGYKAGTELTTGVSNTILGSEALSTATTALNNVAIGTGAMKSVKTATVVDGCVAIGVNALLGNSSNTTGINGTVAVGYAALTALQTGSKNTAVGYQAGLAVTTGASNTVVGYDALVTNIDGSANTAVGQDALYTFEADSAGHGDNTGLGYLAGKFISTGTNNTFVGSNAGLGITGTPLSGNMNTALGYQAGLELEGAAAFNTMIGARAGQTTEAGTENTCIGYNCVAYDDTADNQVVIGNNLTATDKSNAVFIGNNSSHIENDFNSDATWNHSSDVRQKKDIEDDVLGLSFIKDLKTRTYKHKSPSEFPEEWTAYDADDKEPMGGDKVIHGFIAQEVKEALDKAGVDTFQGWSDSEDGRQRVSFEAFVMPLIKAVQELSAQVEELKNK